MFLSKKCTLHISRIGVLTSFLQSQSVPDNQRSEVFDVDGLGNLHCSAHIHTFPMNGI